MLNKIKKIKKSQPSSISEQEKQWLALKSKSSNAPVVYKVQ